MSRLSRTDAAKSTIAVWRWLHGRPDAPKVEGTLPELLRQLKNVGNVSRSSTAGLDDRLRLMEFLGLTTREIHHEGGSRGSFPTVRLTTTLIADVETGAKKIAQHFARGGFLKLEAKGNKTLLPALPVDTGRVAVRTDEQKRPVEAVVGEDAPTIGEGLKITQPEVAETLRQTRKSEPEALVEAARQYEHRQDFVIARLDEMEKLGVKIDREMVMKGINMGRDDELEGVVKILPYIDELELRLKQAEGWRDEMLAARRELTVLRDEKRKAEKELAEQKAANTRLATKMAQETVARPTVLVG